MELSPREHLLWLRAAPPVVLAQDFERYQQLCRDVKNNFRDTNNPLVADAVCKVCLLLPDTGGFDDLPADVVRAALDAPKYQEYRAWFTAGYALYAYRRGDAQQAIERADELGLATPQVQAFALVVRAMAEYSLGEMQQAKNSLASATEFIPAELRTLGATTDNTLLPVSEAVVSHDWLIPEILRREAERLLGAAAGE